MEKNEIKKELYKQKPIAKFDKIIGGVGYWQTTVADQTVTFAIPFEDMGSTEFTSEISSQLLIRWLV